MNAPAPRPVQMRPAARPKLMREALAARLEAAFGPGVWAELGPVSVVGVRGYYQDGMGRPGVNDRGLYDDALFILARGGGFLAFNGNTDPSRFRAGSGTGAQKGMATLKPGLWKAHRFGKHRGEYEALVQRAGPVTVLRDGQRGPYEDTGFFGINIHRGGVGTTSSEGCQTLPPDQWPEFIGALHSTAQDIWGGRWRDQVIPYALMEEAR